jgi:hypothetical protein
VEILTANEIPKKSQKRALLGKPGLSDNPIFMENKPGAKFYCQGLSNHY